MAHTFPAHMNATEKTICNRLFKAVLAEAGNLHMRIHDGEEWATEWTRDLAKVRPEIHATDATRVYIMAVSPDGAAARMGSILLIHGNEDDLVSDASWNSRQPDAEALIDRLCNAASGLQW